MPADDKEMWKQLKRLNEIVFCIEFLEYSGNAIGTVAFLGATVVLLGGFRSVLSPMDFWFAAVMIFMEGTRIFISKDTSVNQWLFGSTRAFRWDHFCFPKIHDYGNLIAMGIGVGISLAPIEIGSQTITGIIKVALLAITSLLLTRGHWGWFAKAVILLLGLASVCGTFYASYKLTPSHRFGFSRANLKFAGLFYAWLFGTLAGAFVTAIIMACVVVCCRLPVFCLKVIVALALVFLPFLHAKLGSKHIYFRISIATALLTVNIIEALALDLFKEDISSSSPLAPPAEQDNSSSSPDPEQEQSNALLLGTSKLFSKIVDTILPILFFWGVMFPLPGISLKVSFYMLFSVIAAVLVGNLQIPVAFLQILLSSLRLHSLLAGHHSHRDYHPLPDGASKNLVPSIVVFYVLELCQGSTNILGIIIGLISFSCRRKLVRALGLKEDWGAKAVNLYYHQACMTIKDKGLFPLEESTPPSLDSFAIESLGCTSSEMQIVRLQVLDYYLRQQADSKYRKKLIAQIANDVTGIVTKIAGTISHLIADEEINSGNRDKVKKIHFSLTVSVKFVKLLADAEGIRTRIRQELKGNPILVHSLQRILDLEDCPQELKTATTDVKELPALNDEAVS